MTKYKVVPAEMSNDKMREEFDSWIERQGMSTMKDGETYYDHTTHAAWQAWKASRAAPAVQGEPVGWYTEDHLDDKSATTYKAEVAQRWRAKGWPVTPLYTAPQPVEQQPTVQGEPVRWMYSYIDGTEVQTSKERWTGRDWKSYWEETPLYAASQPSPSVSALVEALSALRRCIMETRGPDAHAALVLADAALATYSEQGGRV